jgi:plasmid stability protein
VAQLVVRQLEEALVQSLRERAAKAGVSMEEAHRRILREALASLPPKDFAQYLLSIPEGDVDVFERQRTTSPPLEL